MKILEMHEIKSEYLNPELYKTFDIITFDDGLYSQFYYMDFFKSLHKPLKYFISSGIIHCGNNQTFKDPLTAHNDFFSKNDTSAYMNIEQIKELSINAEIGWHLHWHPQLSFYKPITAMKIILNEIKKGEDFITYFNCKSFCFPYNNENNFLKYNLKKCGFINFYGAQRINFEDLYFPNNKTTCYNILHYNEY